MTNSLRPTTAWRQEALLPPPFVTVKTLVGINTSTGAVQALLESRAATSEELLSMYAWPMSDVRSADTTLQELLKAWNILLDDYRGPFPH